MSIAAQKGTVQGFRRTCKNTSAPRSGRAGPQEAVKPSEHPTTEVPRTPVPRRSWKIGIPPPTGEPGARTRTTRALRIFTPRAFHVALGTRGLLALGALDEERVDAGEHPRLVLRGGVRTRAVPYARSVSRGPSKAEDRAGAPRRRERGSRGACFSVAHSVPRSPFRTNGDYAELRAFRGLRPEPYWGYGKVSGFRACLRC
jgi:hypothetical protein